VDTDFDNALSAGANGRMLPDERVIASGKKCLALDKKPTLLVPLALLGE
jgi:hypothetical protein